MKDEAASDGVPEDKEKLDQNEAKFNYKQQKLQTDMEMWFMEAIPELYGVDDSEELAEELQEDGQAEVVEKLLRCGGDAEKIRGILATWLVGDVDGGKRDDFVGKVVTMTLKAGFSSKKK